MAKDDLPLSAFARAIAEQAEHRRVHPFEVTGYFGIAGKPIPQVGIRVPTQYEQDRALVGAHAYVQSLSGGNEDAKRDADLLQNAKLAHIAYEFCRSAEAPAIHPTTGEPLHQQWDMPAFPSPRWMCEHLSPEKIAVLVNLANEVRVKEAPSPSDINDEHIEAIVGMCCDHAGDNVPEAALAGYSREFLTHALVLVSLKLKSAREALAAASAEKEASDVQG